jgi:hypothetical protein
MPRAVDPLVNMFNCFEYDWTVKDEWKVTWHDPKLDVDRCWCNAKYFFHFKYNKTNGSTALGMHSVLLPKDLVGSSLICRLNFFLNMNPGMTSNRMIFDKK